MFTPNRCPDDRIHRNLPPGAPCDCISKAEADEIVTPRRAPRGRTTTPAAHKKSALSNQLPLTPPSTSAQAATGLGASTGLDPSATPTPAPFGPHLKLSGLGTFTPQATQETLFEQQIGDDFDIHDNITVASRRSIPSFSNEGTTVIEPSSPQPESIMGDNITIAPRQPIVHHDQLSSTSTQIVPETIYDNTPSLGEAGPSNYHDPPRRRDSVTSLGPAPTPALDDIAQHRTDLEIQHLRRSRAQYASELEESTGLVDRLQTRRQIQEADAAVNQAMLDQLGKERQEAWGRAIDAESRRKRSKTRLGSILMVLMIMVLAYGCWCVYMSPEMEYIYKRREEILRE